MNENKTDMAEEEYKEKKWKHKHYGGGGSGALYGIGILGTLVYYLQHATNFTEGIIGILKAIFWPGVLLYKVFTLLKM